MEGIRTFPFLSLAPELREMVYFAYACGYWDDNGFLHLFKGVQSFPQSKLGPDLHGITMKRSYYSRTSGRQSRAEKRLRSPPPLLSANSLVRDEAVYLLLRESRIVVQEGSAVPDLLEFLNRFGGNGPIMAVKFLEVYEEGSALWKPVLGNGGGSNSLALVQKCAPGLKKLLLQLRIGDFEDGQVPSVEQAFPHLPILESVTITTCSFVLPSTRARLDPILTWVKRVVRMYKGLKKKHTSRGLRTPQIVFDWDVWTFHAPVSPDVAKNDFWNDFAVLMNDAGIELPTRSRSRWLKV